MVVIEEGTGRGRIREPPQMAANHSHRDFQRTLKTSVNFAPRERREEPWTTDLRDVMWATSYHRLDVCPVMDNLWADRANNECC